MKLNRKGFALFLSSNFMEASKAYEKAINIKENPNYFFNYGYIQINI